MEEKEMGKTDEGRVDAYEKPEIEVIEIEIESPILALSSIEDGGSA